MGRFYGKVGYAETVETPVGSGVWKENITERSYYGDVIKLSRRLTTAANINDDIVVGNEIRILADPYALQHFNNIRYINWSNVNWKVAKVSVSPPRLILTLGGVYNGISGPTS